METDTILRLWAIGIKIFKALSVGGAIIMIGLGIYTKNYAYTILMTYVAINIYVDFYGRKSRIK